MKRFLTLLAFILSNSAPAAHAVTAYDAPPGVFVEDSFGASVVSEYFTTAANYEDTRGSFKHLPGDSNLTLLETRLRGRYTFSRKASAFLGTSYVNVRAVDLLNTKTNAQISEALAGFDYLLNTKYVQFVPEIIVSYPLDQSSSTQNVPMTNDGMPYVRTGLFGHKPYRRFRLGAFAGIHYPIGGLAKRFLYEATIDARLFSAWTIGGGINGYESLIGDTGNLTDRQTTAARANASSERFFSYNPSLIEARAWFGFRPDKTLWIRAGYGKTINGLHSAEGQSFLVSLVYNTSHVDFTSPNPKVKRKFDPDEAAKTFEADVEETDQGVFEPEDEENANTARGRGALDATEKLLEKKSKDK